MPFGLRNASPDLSEADRLSNPGSSGHVSLHGQHFDRFCDAEGAPGAPEIDIHSIEVVRLGSQSGEYLFGFGKTDFLGYRLTKNGAQPLPKKSTSF